VHQRRPHAFRYSIATDAAIKPDGNPFGAATRLGHADPNTTIGYTRDDLAVAAVAKRHAAAIREALRLAERLTGWSEEP
jgi:hypothetical protein